MASLFIHESRHMNKCVVCGAEFIPNRGTKGLCCGSRCSTEYTKIYYSKPKQKAICIECGQEFEVSRESKGMYCSRKCSVTKQFEEARIKANQAAFIQAANRLAARKKKEHEEERQGFIRAANRLKLCMECGNLFVSYNGTIYCSDDCRSRRENRLSEEHVRYKDTPNPDYSITLLKLMKRNGKRCNICGKELDINIDPCSKDYPTIDHIKPISKGGAHKWDNVQLLCRSCNSRKYNK